MRRRSEAGEAFANVEGKIMTVEPDSGETIALADNTTVKSCSLEPKQYLWFQDQDEDTRVRKLILRGSRLTEDVTQNSRGVKHGMAMICEEEETETTY